MVSGVCIPVCVCVCVTPNRSFLRASSRLLFDRPPPPISLLRDAWGRAVESSRAHEHSMCVLLLRGRVTGEKSHGLLAASVNVELSAR